MSKPKLLQKNAEEELSLEETSPSPRVEEKCINIPSDRKYSLFGAKNVALSLSPLRTAPLHPDSRKTMHYWRGETKEKNDKAGGKYGGLQKGNKIRPPNRMCAPCAPLTDCTFFHRSRVQCSQKNAGCWFYCFLGGMQRKVFRFETPCKDSFALC